MADSGALRCTTFRDATGAAASAFVPDREPGPGTPLFCVPALGLDGRSFTTLAPLAAERRVVLWNPPNELPCEPGLDAIAGVALRHADLAGMPRRYVLLGSSLGSVISLAAMLAAPERVAGLVLVGATASWRELGPSMRWARPLHPFIPRRIYHKALARMLCPGASPPGSLTAFLRMQMEHRTKEHLESIITALTGGGDFDLRPRLAEVSAPTLIVQSLRDIVTPYAAAKTLASIRNATLVAVEGGSHLPYLDDPERFLATLRPFLAKVDAAEAAA